MIKYIFPETINNDNKIGKFSYYSFIAFSIIVLFRSLVHSFYFDGGAQSIASIPLDKYSSNASHTIVFIFAFWGTLQLVFWILDLIAIIKYKTMIPMLICFHVLDYIFHFITKLYRGGIVTESTAPAEIGDILIPTYLVIVLIVGYINHKKQNKNKK